MKSEQKKLILDKVALELSITRVIDHCDLNDYNSGVDFDIAYQDKSFQKLLGKLYLEKTTPLVSRNIAIAMMEEGHIVHFYFAVQNPHDLEERAFLFITSKLAFEINEEYRAQFERFQKEYLKTNG